MNQRLMWAAVAVCLLPALAAGGCGGDGGAREGKVAARATAPARPASPPATAKPKPSPKPLPTRSVPRVDCARVQCLALTFDDGPGEHTGRLLDMLRRYDAPSTFYVLGGSAKGEERLLRRMTAEGHEIGNHTYGHPNLVELSSERIRSEIRRTQDVVRKAVGSAPRTMRPPYGSTDERVAKAVGMPQIFWRSDTRDWADRDANVVARRVLDIAAPGAVILLHDTLGSSVDAMKKVLPELKRRGYRLVTVSQLRGTKPFKPGGVYYREWG
ncbi:polysaccharide deacetylase family protein [Bailinhaonella thermotolerans]|uniref:NodB homology domain-containing protein n=1 Tax=Bailinhaonella thermotolerans TaxID=1070861 RepID=A0A3A4AMM1_9ACTN|nr:polysaccharide deacetylase family protein [Bailinhaonella thermotolerans]RJL30926.1 hypothetical protein D5H75_21785 [Bailinhaonella thermotolerans]